MAGIGGATMNTKHKTVFYGLLLATIFCIYGVGLLGCNNPLASHQEYATVRIDLGDDAGTRNPGRSDYQSRAIPEGVVSFTLTVTADDMDTIEKEFDSTPIELSVPAGEQRTFTLTTYDANGIKLYSGSKTVDLTGGEDMTLRIVLDLLSGKFLITGFGVDVLLEIPGVGNLVNVTINQDLKAILAVVPVGTPIGSLPVSVQVSEGATVEPEDGSKVDFSSGPVTFTVTAENGKTQDYTVTVIGNKLHVLDPAYDTTTPVGRIVQIDDLTGTGFTPRTFTDYLPYKIDYDIYGRMYIVNYSSSNPGIIRLDDIGDSTPDTIVSDTSRVPALAIDRDNSWIYYLYEDTAPNYKLARCDYNGNNVKTYGYIFEDYNFTNFLGLTIDENGILYINHNTMAAGGHEIMKYDPSGSGSVVKKITAADVPVTWAWDDIRDILYKDGYLYVADYGNSTTETYIYQLNQDLTDSGVPPLTIPDDSGSPHGDDYTGVKRFLAVLNRKFYVIDDHSIDSDNYDRIIAFYNLSMVGWETMWADAVTGDLFEFFNNYS
jgi:hypothetical protein